MTARYASLEELRDAYASGALSRDFALTLDNDHAGVYVSASEDDPGEDVFGMYPEEVLEQALDLLGIPHDHV